MYLNDAQDVAVPRKIEPEQKPDPKIMAWYSEAQGRGRGHTAGRRQAAGGDICRYINGRHACYDFSDYCPAVEPRVYVHQPDQGVVFTRRVF